MKEVKSYFLVGILLVVIASCSTTKVNPTYRIIPDDSAYVKPVSIVALPIQLSYRALEQTVHQSLSDMLYEDLSFDDNNTDNVMLRIQRKDTIRINGEGNKLRLQAPLHIWVKYRFRKKILGITVEETFEKKLEVATTIQSQLSVTPQWKLTSRTQTTIDTRLLPAIQMPGFVIDLNQLLNPIIRAQEKKVSKLIDDGLPQWVDIKSEVNKYWQTLQQPISLDTTYHAWLLVQPQMITLSEISYSKEAALLGVNFLLSGEIRTSKGIPFVAQKPLPDLQRTQGINNGFNISMPVRLLYTQLTQTLNAQLSNKWYAFEENKHQLYIEQVEVFPSDDKLGVSISFHGVSRSRIGNKKLNGKLILTCTPHYDAATKTLHFKGLDYSVSTSDILLKTASWILQGKTFKQNIENKMVVPLGNQLNQLRDLSTKAINTKLANDVYLKGNVQSVDIDGIRLLDESFIVYLKAKGQVHLVFTP